MEAVKEPLTRSHHHKRIWSDEQIEELKRLWGLGYSAERVARCLAAGFTRNAVIGKVHRLNLDTRPKPAPRERTPRKRANKLTRMMFDGRSVPAWTDGNNVPLFDLFPDNNPHPTKNTPFMSITIGQCREVVGKGDDGLAMFCGAQAHDSWCGYHARKNFSGLAVVRWENSQKTSPNRAQEIQKNYVLACEAA
jgi:hypothetical protein